MLDIAAQMEIGSGLKTAGGSGLCACVHAQKYHKHVHCQMRALESGTLGWVQSSKHEYNVVCNMTNVLMSKDYTSKLTCESLCTPT